MLVGLHFSLEALGDNPFLWSFLAYGPSLHLQNEQLQVESFPHCITHIFCSQIFFYFSLQSFSSISKTPCDYVWPTQTILHNIPITRSLTWSHAKSLLPCKITCMVWVVDIFGRTLFCLSQQTGVQTDLTAITVKTSQTVPLSSWLFFHP